MAENESLNSLYSSPQHNVQSFTTTISIENIDAETDETSDDLVDDGKIQEFISRIELLEKSPEIDSGQSDKFQFKEFLELPHRLRHPSFNFDDGQSDEKIEDEFETISLDRSPNYDPNKQELSFKFDKIPVGNQENLIYKTEAFIASEKELSDNSNKQESSYRSVDKTFNVNRQESNYSTISNESGSHFMEERVYTKNVFTRTERSISRSSEQSNYNDLEYIKGREDWRDIPVIPIKEQVDSDDYHHSRRHSETAENLEYIRGREDWAIFMQSQVIPEITISIRDEVDSDEYHHGRALSEALDLSIYGYTRDGKRFLTQGSAKNGRDRSPYKLMNAEDIEKDEFFRKYYWNTNLSSRAVSENRDLAEEEMIKMERMHWMKSPTHLRLNSDPDQEEVAEGGTSGSEDERVTVVEATNDNDFTTVNVEIDSNDNDVIEVALWDLESDPEEIEPTEDQTSSEINTEIDQIPLDILENIEIPENTEESISHQTTLKKSKRIDNLLEAERIDSFDVPVKEKSVENEINEKLSTENKITIQEDKVENKIINLEEKLENKIAKTDRFLETEKLEQSKYLSKNSQSKVTDDKIQKFNQKLSERKISKSGIDQLLIDTSLGPWFHK